MTLQFLLLPIRDWNKKKVATPKTERQHCNFYYSLLGIETQDSEVPTGSGKNCNFYYSLLGIETPMLNAKASVEYIAISITPY